MAHTPDILNLSQASLEMFLNLLSADKITRSKDRVTIHAASGDAHWFFRDGRWVSAAPAFEREKRFGASGTLH